MSQRTCGHYKLSLSLAKQSVNDVFVSSARRVWHVPVSGSAHTPRRMVLKIIQLRPPTKRIRFLEAPPKQTWVWISEDDWFGLLDHVCVIPLEGTECFGQALSRFLV